MAKIIRKCINKIYKPRTRGINDANESPDIVKRKKKQNRNKNKKTTTDKHQIIILDLKNVKKEL